MILRLWCRLFGHSARLYPTSTTTGRRLLFACRRCGRLCPFYLVN